MPSEAAMRAANHIGELVFKVGDDPDWRNPWNERKIPEIAEIIDRETGTVDADKVEMAGVIRRLMYEIEPAIRYDSVHSGLKDAWHAFKDKWRVMQ